MRYLRMGGYLVAGALSFGIFGIMLGGAALAAQEVKLNETEFAFDPPTVKTDAGEVTFVVTNTGQYPHGFAIDGITKTLPRIEPGDTARLTLKLPKGTYTFYCPVKGHRGKGMEGALGAGVAPKAVEKAPAPAPRRYPGY
ncbi:MAG: cupredoxin domain-containing protein [Candidatus Methylomirabilales bacterium]